ncbi:hypothetical protein P0Y35_07000 [Kiritimatiellaeota bacterium B1221]|nr:hypothetical protein [Kiritimatiellaeota bacterium B1221]
MNHKTITIVCVTMMTAAIAQGQSLYWDTNGAAAGAGSIADGTWDESTTANWTTDAAGTSATGTYTSGSDVVFSAGSDVTSANITVSGTQIVNSLTFKEGNVVLSGSNLDDLSGSNVDITVNSGASGTISVGSFNSNLAIEGSFNASTLGSGGYVYKTGAGTATINRLDARIIINGGTIISSGVGGKKIKQTTINNSGTLRITGDTLVSGKTTMAVNTGGTLEMAAGISQTVSFFTGGGSVIGEAGSELKVGGDNKSTTFDGDISGDLDLFSIGTGSFTLSDSSSMEFQISGDGANNAILGDGINDTATNLNGSFSFDLSGADLTAGNSWQIVDIAGLNETFGGTFNVVDFTNNSGVWTNDSNSDLIFSQATGALTVIPEPSTLSLMIGFAGLTFLMFRNRR